MTCLSNLQLNLLRLKYFKDVLDLQKTNKSNNITHTHTHTKEKEVGLGSQLVLAIVASILDFIEEKSSSYV